MSAFLSELQHAWISMDIKWHPWSTTMVSQSLWDNTDTIFIFMGICFKRVRYIHGWRHIHGLAPWDLQLQRSRPVIRIAESLRGIHQNGYNYETKKSRRRRRTRNANEEWYMEVAGCSPRKFQNSMVANFCITDRCIHVHPCVSMDSSADRARGSHNRDSRTKRGPEVQAAHIPRISRAYLFGFKKDPAGRCP